MNNKIWIGIGVAVLVVVAGGLYVARTAKSPTDGYNTMPVQQAPGEQKTEAPVIPENVVVEIRAGEFSPSNVTITKGVIVVFENKDSVPHWPASAPHPAHTCYPGFDAKKSVAPGELFSVTANVVKTCGFHDHLNTGLRGTLTVIE